MSTIDMTQVAGLQAVDAEGNVIGTLSVNDLTELVANNLVKSTQNQVFAARSVSTMSEASTLAVSDEYENTLPIDANPASVRTLDSEGNPKQTAISALAQVVGGLVSQINTICMSIYNTAASEKYIGSLDDITKTSMYKGTSETQNGPDSIDLNGSIICTYAFDGTARIQIIYHYNYDYIFVRRCYGTWLVWRKIVLQSI